MQISCRRHAAVVSGYKKQQLSNWPVTFLTLSQMPSLYIDEKIVMLAKAKLADKDRERLMAHAFARADRIREVVRRLEASYKPEIHCIAGK